MRGDLGYVQVKLFLWLTTHHSMKTYGGVDMYLHVFLTSVVDGGEWSASRSSHFTPGEEIPVIHWIGDWVDHRANVDVVVRRRKAFLCSCQEFKSCSPAQSLVTMLTEHKQSTDLRFIAAACISLLRHL